jgi:type VI secretion system protein ImpA
MNRVKYDSYFITSEIPESVDGVGDDLSLSLIYDEIKNAREEDDSRLSMGIWERELKKADWPLVESLAVDILSSKSKDLQVVAWLIEAIVSMDGLNGIPTAFSILKLFLESFWYTCFPKNEDNSSDEGMKINILNWIESCVSDKILMYSFVENVTLYEYEYAVQMKALGKRSADVEAEISRDIQKNHRKTLDEIHGLLKRESMSSIRPLEEEIAKINVAIASLKETLGKILGDPQIVSFSRVVDQISEIYRIIDQTCKQEPAIQGKNEISEIVNKETSDDIYSQLSKFSMELKRLEKHSPVPFMLDLIVRWKDKTLFEIMNDLKTGETEAHKLLKILINPSFT